MDLPCSIQNLKPKWFGRFGESAGGKLLFMESRVTLRGYAENSKEVEGQENRMGEGG